MSQPRPPDTYLAFDYGLRRTGVASGSRTLGRGSPLRTIAAEGQARFAPIEALIREWRPDALVVGVPRHPDGAEHDNTRRARRFARQLHGRFRLPVHEVDERYTTTEALAAGVRDADASAAALLLTQHFDELDRAAQVAALASSPEQDPEETNPPKD
ncbi:Holliday junction resolvase RuvX [Sphaerotilus sulfidivorans]